MPEPLTQLDTTRLLIAEHSENTAHELDSCLRDAGIPTRLRVSDDLTDILNQIVEGDTDIALLTDKLEGVEQLIPKIKDQAPHTPVILLTDNPEPAAVVEALGLGASDVVSKQASEQLALVVKRELSHVSNRKNFSHLRRALKEAEQRCQLLLQTSEAAIAYVHEGMHIHANDQYLRLFGYIDTNEIIGVSLVDIIHSDSAEDLKTALKTLRTQEDSDNLELDAKIQGDDENEVNIRLARAEYEGESCLQITLRTRTAESQPAIPSTPAAEQLELPGFLKSAESFFSNCDGYAYVLVAQIDQISALQSAYGLAGSETICRRVWHELWEVAEDYPVTRLSNNQFAFAVIAESYTHVKEIAESYREAINNFIFEVQDKTIRPTISVSGALVDSTKGVNATLDEAFSNLLAVAERDSANTVDIPNALSAASEMVDDAKIILRQITDAIENKQFVILFQPIISLRGDSDEHYEVFLRMTNDEGEQIEPAKFLQTAIDNNVAGKIDRWVLLQAIKTLGAHRAQGHATRMTINLTANSVLDTEFLQWLSVAIKAARLPSDAVIFQITEHDASTYLRQTREFIEGLRKMHCRASMSRFGINPESFETLRHIPVDMVKIDGGCVADIETDDGARSKLIETIKQLQSNGKLTVVPMVENAGVLSTLWQAGANYIQGHYLQEPSSEMDYDFSTED
ncbi:MAG: EAL domain-containing protein [Pseudomonadota bacterium]